MNPAHAHLLLAREQLRRKDYIPFLHAMVARHAELARPVDWDAFVAICQREHVTVRVVALAAGHEGQLVRVGSRPFILINVAVPRLQRPRVGMHELTHFWRDDPKMPVYHATADWRTAPEEDFANVFAWMVTTAPRTIPGTFADDF